MIHEVDAETFAETCLCKESCSLAEVSRLARLLLRDKDTLTFGAFVHVKGGLRLATNRFPDSVRILSRCLAKMFPRDHFLTMQLQRSRAQDPHKDRQNAHFPTLLLNLSPEAPGGTWIEDPQGREAVLCSDGETRLGTTLRGVAYRFSARSHWHGAAATPQERLVLLAWVPAGWTCLGNLEIDRLCRLGFRLPDRASEERCRMSEWSARTMVQRSLEEVVQSVRRWDAGVLQHQVSSCAALHVCMSSDEEVQPSVGELNWELTPRAIICLDSDRDEDTSQNSDVVQCVDPEFMN